jgi:LmbE family N-acetylglucosaminyl deacetylase
VGHDDGTGIEFPRVAVQHELSRNVERTAPHVVIIGLADWASIMGEIDDSMTEGGVLKKWCEKWRSVHFTAVSKVVGEFQREGANRPPAELEDARPPQL